MFALLLRGMLCISLILNGSGYAMTSAHLQMGHTDRIAAMQEPAPADMPPCHQNADASETVAVESPEAVKDQSRLTSKHPARDCCESGACQCACMQAHAALPVNALRHDVAGHANDVRPLQPDYPAPALPHLIRPPISYATLRHSARFGLTSTW